MNWSGLPLFFRRLFDNTIIRSFPVPFGILCFVKIYKSLSFLILEYIIEVSSSKDSKSSYDILSTLLCILFLFSQEISFILTCRWKSSTKLIFEGAIVQLHLACRDHCFARFSSTKFISLQIMIRFFHGNEEPSKMCLVSTSRL